AAIRSGSLPGATKMQSGGRMPVHTDLSVPLGSAEDPQARESVVLVIDDSAVHRAEVRRALETSPEIGEIIEAANGVAGLKTLLSRPLDAVLCDIEMPGFDGEKLLAAKQQRAEIADIPILFVSAHRNPDRTVRLLERGASDLIEKPFHSEEL